MDALSVKPKSVIYIYLERHGCVVAPYTCVLPSMALDSRLLDHWYLSVKVDTTLTIPNRWICRDDRQTLQT